MPFAYSISKIFTSGLFLLMPLVVSCQDFEVLSFKTAYYPKQRINESTLEGELGFLEWGVQIAVPQLLNKNKKTVFIHKFGYNQLTIESEGSLDIGFIEKEKQYHVVYYSLGLVQALNTKWQLGAQITPTIASDFGEYLSDDDLLFQANLFLVRSKNKQLKYGFGLSYSTRFGTQLLLPMGIFKYNTKKVRLDMILPNRLEFMLKTKADKFSYGLLAGLNGGIFHNTSKATSSNNRIENVGYSRLVVGPSLAWKVKKLINIHLYGGVVFGRKLDFIESDGELRNRSPQSTPFVGLGISFCPKNNAPTASLNIN